VYDNLRDPDGKKKLSKEKIKDDISAVLIKTIKDALRDAVSDYFRVGRNVQN
jgi:hypothetical protein